MYLQLQVIETFVDYILTKTKQTGILLNLNIIDNLLLPVKTIFVSLFGFNACCAIGI